MKTSLAHLPAEKQKEVKAIQEVILKYLDPIMIILFGSYARGDWVEDVQEENGKFFSYGSDYDILVITHKYLDNKKLKQWDKIERCIAKLETKVTLIKHNIDFINKKLRGNFYFFVDILKEGIMLYDTGTHPLASPLLLSPTQRKQKAEQDFKHWMEKGDRFFKVFNFCLSEDYNNNAAFELHQVAESYYSALLLVYTDYKDKTHDLEEINQQAIKISRELKEIFPCQTKEEQDKFQLLRKAYVEARYSKVYSITKEELMYLAQRIKVLRALIEKLCKEKIAAFV